MKQYLFSKGLTQTGKKPTLIKRILEHQATENLVDETVNVADGDQPSERELLDVRLESMITRVVQRMMNPSQSQTVNQAQQPTSSITLPPVNEEENILDRNHVEEFLLQQAEKAKNDDNRHPSSIKRDLKNGS